MNTSKLANISEIVSSIAIVLTLIYLTIELNQNTRVTIAAASQETTKQSLDFFSLGIDNEILARALHKQSTGEELGGLEQHQIWRQQYFNFRVFENAYLQYHRGFYDETEWDRYRRIITRRLTKDPIAKQMWEESAGDWTIEFSNEVNGIEGNQ